MPEIAAFFYFKSNSFANPGEKSGLAHIVDKRKELDLSLLKLADVLAQ